MGSIWTVAPSDNRVDLVWETAPTGPQPFWVRLKDLLTVGEDRRVKTAGWRGVGGIGGKEQEIRVDWREMGFVRAFVWITDWSLKDDKDNKLKLSIDTFETLHPDLFEVIENAITQHIEALEAKKKNPAQPIDGNDKPPETRAS